jgi:hypothetical protein
MVCLLLCLIRESARMAGVALFMRPGNPTFGLNLAVAKRILYRWLRQCSRDHRIGPDIIAKRCRRRKPLLGHMGKRRLARLSFARAD